MLNLNDRPQTIGRVKWLFAILALALVLLVLSPKASALSGSEFQAGNIIDDTIFFNASSMSPQDIQNFLNSKVPSCDTWGTQRHSSGATRAQYGSSRGYAPPYTCLKDYSQATQVKPAESGLCSYYGGGHKSSAQIIYDVAQVCGINPQVLLVLLQKEQSLVSDDWPWSSQYRSATGYGCPDTAPCDAEYYGYFNQVYHAARIYKKYARDANQYNYRAGRTNSILYNPNAGCGRSDVFIQNQATAGLYVYTPYQPNAAALNNLYGTGDGCSAYGNRNFWRMWNDWFGSTHGSVGITSSLSVSSGYGPTLHTGRTITATFTMRNNSSQRQDLGTMAIAVRDSQGTNFDFGSQHIVLQPWQEYRYVATRQLDTEERYSFAIVNYRAAYGWSDIFPDTYAGYSRTRNDVIVQAAPVVVEGPTVSKPNLHAGEPATVTMKVRNPGSKYPVNLGYFGLAIASPTGRNADLPFDTVASLAPGAEYVYQKTFTPTEAGSYAGRISSTTDGGATWSETAYPLPRAGTNNRVSIGVRSNPTLTQGMTGNTQSLRAGDTLTGSFKVKNFSASAVTVNKNICYIVRGSLPKNYDLGCLQIGVLQPGEEKTFTGSKKLDDAGQYRAFFSMYDGTAWYDNWSFERETGSEATGLTFGVRSSPTLTGGVAGNISNLRAGDPFTGTFTVTNNSSSTVTVNKNICYIVRSASNRNYDLGCLALTTMQAGEERVFTATRQLDETGQYRAFFSMYDGRYWYDNWSFERETGSEATSLVFSTRSNPTLTQGMTGNTQSLRAGDTLTGSFKVKNFSASAVTVNKNICYIVRGSLPKNYDLGCLQIGVLQPGEEKTFTGSKKLDDAGQYRAFFSMYDGTAWYDNWSFERETGSEATGLTFGVAP